MALMYVDSRVQRAFSPWRLLFTAVGLFSLDREVHAYNPLIDIAVPH